MASIWGEAHDKKSAEFDLAVDKIQIKYPHEFEGKVNRINDKIPDAIRNHYVITYNVNSTGIGFLKDTYIPKYIQDEVISVFKLVFSDQ